MKIAMYWVVPCTVWLVYRLTRVPVGINSIHGGKLDFDFPWNKFLRLSRVEDQVRAHGSASRGMRPRRKLPDLPRMKGSASHTGNIQDQSMASIVAPNYSQLRSGSNTAPSTPPTSVLNASSVIGHELFEWNYNHSNNGRVRLSFLTSPL